MVKALLIIDMQKFVEERIRQGIGYYPHDAINRMVHLVQTFRDNHQKVMHVRHQTSEPGSLLHPQSPSYPAIAALEAKSDEPVFIKNTSSAFVSTDLKSYIDEHLITEVTVIGAVAGFCVNSTVRNGSDLGIKMTVVSDAVLSFDLPTVQGSAKNIHDVTMALLHADFATVTSASALHACVGD